jgi:FAD/FMN-containing dehydrogenase
VLDATVASSAAERARLWQLREAHTEAISSAGVPVKLDVSVPVGRLAELVGLLPDTVAAVAPASQLVVFGHLAEANLHVNVLEADAEAVTRPVLELVASLGGSVSSEHGIGRAKASYLGMSRSQAEIDVMRAVKAAFDPLGLLNPGVLFPPAASASRPS